MMTRLIALTNLFLQFDQVKQIFRGVKGAPQKSETAMIKDVINETTASIELKLNKLYFKMALSLVLVSVLAYGVIRLIWYFENYLMLNYGQNYAVLLMVVVVGLVAAQMIYAKAIMDKVTREKREMMIEKVQREEDAHHQEPGFFAAPEKLLHQAFLGFLDGFSRTSRRRKPLELPAGDSVAEFQHRLQPN